MTHRPSLAEPAFPDDDGTTAPELAAAFGDDERVLAALGDVRVFVPVVATLGDPADEGAGGGSGPRAEKSAGGGSGQRAEKGAGGGSGQRAEKGTDKDADMAAVLMTGADGRRALLAFSSVATMQAWDPHARPVAVWGRDAARAALDEGASALLLDLANPSFTVVETDDVEHLAAGHRLVRTDAGTAWVASA